MLRLPVLLLAGAFLLLPQTSPDGAFPLFPAPLSELLALSSNTADQIRRLVVERRERAEALSEKLFALRSRRAPAEGSASLRKADADDDLATRARIEQLLTARQREVVRRLGETMSPLPRFVEAACFLLLPAEVAAKAPPAAAPGGAPLQSDAPLAAFTCPPLRLPQRLLPQ